MVSLHQLFREFCSAYIAPAAADLTPDAKLALVEELKRSPFRTVIQAWSVLDFYHYQHLYAEGYEKWLGWPDAEMTAERILEIVHPDDQPAFAELYSLVLQGLLAMPIPVKGIGHFSISYRVRTRGGAYVKVLETNNIIASDPVTNVPLINLSQMVRVDDRSEKVKYYFLIEDAEGSVDIMASYLRQHDKVVNIFSPTEIKVVELLRHGLTSAAIADRLCLSKHSIDKYRKNLLEKTGCANTAALLTHMAALGGF